MLRKLAFVFIRLGREIIFMPCLLPFILTTEKNIMTADIARWMSIIYHDNSINHFQSLLLLFNLKEFRTVCYYRLKHGNFISLILEKILSGIYKPQWFCFITTQDLGPGLFLEHGFGTIISARSIGANAWINQQVTIGSTNAVDCPTIGDNVSIYAGAKVIGNVYIGNNVKIGANAVVLKDVPDNCTVVGVPARIVRQNGIRVMKDL